MNAQPDEQSIEFFNADEVDMLCAAVRGQMDRFLAGAAKSTVRPFVFGEALVLSARYNKSQIVEWLLDHQIDVNTVGHLGRTALQFVSHPPKREMVRLLVSRGAIASPDFPPVRPETPEIDKHLVVAAKVNDLPALRSALGKGAHVDARCPQGYTALMHACAQVNYRAALTLLAAGAEINARAEGSGITPLTAAAERSQWQLEPTRGICNHLRQFVKSYWRRKLIRELRRRGAVMVQEMPPLMTPRAIEFRENVARQLDNPPRGLIDKAITATLNLVFLERQAEEQQRRAKRNQGAIE